MNTFPYIPADKKSLLNRRLVYGVGINDADYVINQTINGKRVICPYYLTWKNMLKRAYSREFLLKNFNYSGTTICQEWLLFSTFKAWMKKKSWEGMAIDKDIIIVGNKHYCPENCRFVTSAVNNLLTDSRSARGNYPKGVNWHKASSSFVAKCGFNGKQKHLGIFSTAEEASAVYREFKSNLIREIAETQTDPAIRLGLIHHADAMYNYENLNCASSAHNRPVAEVVR